MPVDLSGSIYSEYQRTLKRAQKLVEGGNTMIVIEHNLDVIKNADYIIDMGPEGGMKGGYIVATGTPEELAGNNDSATGQYLKKLVKSGSR